MLEFDESVNPYFPGETVMQSTECMSILFSAVQNVFLEVDDTPVFDFIKVSVDKSLDNNGISPFFLQISHSKLGSFE